MSERDIFTAAQGISEPAARAAYLAKACGSDAALRQRVEQLFGPTEADEDEDADDDPIDFLEPSKRPDSLGRIGHYEVLEVLGRGAFGIVFRAFDDMLQRVVAVKVLAPELATTSPARKRFLREARSSAAVRHENVVQVHAVEEQPFPYLVMEFVPGETLQERIDHIGPLESAEVVRIGQQIANGLAAAHAMGLIHRDIKPANVLIGSGPREHVKLTDFGLARAADDASMTQSGLVTGTPMYMSPEQARGERLDHRSDLFSLGSVLYVMLSGRPPFRAANALAVLKRVNEDTPRPVTDIIQEAPEALCAIIAQLHAKDPAERVQSAQEVADLLAGCLTNSPQSKSTTASPAITATPSNGQSKAAPSPTTASTVQREQRHGVRSSRFVVVATILLLIIGLVLTEATGTTHLRSSITRLWDNKEATSPTLVKAGDAEPKVIDPDRKKNSISERRAAEHFREKQVEMTVVIDGKEILIPAGADLPTELFVIDYLKLNANVDVGSIPWIAELSNLRRVYVPPKDADRWAEAITIHPAITMINAFGCDLTDKGLARFGKLTKLEYLNLHGCSSITGAGLQTLAGCRSLTKLNLDSTMLQSEKYTRADLQELRRALPNIAFTQDDAKPISDSPVDPDRQAALWLRSQGPMRVDVLTDGDALPRNIEAGQPLPTVPFKLVGVIFKGEEIDRLGSNLADKLAVQIKGVRLKNVYLHRSLTVAGLAKLVQLPEFAEVSYVNLGDTTMDDGLFAHLAKLPNLNNLDGGPFPNVTGKGISALKACLNLQHLTLIDTSLSPEGIEEIQQLTALQYLNISVFACTERHAEALAKLKINQLVAASAGIDDKMAARLANFEKLESLSVAGNPLTDKGLAEFKKLKWLKSLNIGATQVTAIGVADLRKALPNCNIQKD